MGHNTLVAFSTNARVGLGLYRLCMCDVIIAKYGCGLFLSHHPLLIDFLIANSLRKCPMRTIHLILTDRNFLFIVFQRLFYHLSFPLHKIISVPKQTLGDRPCITSSLQQSYSNVAHPNTVCPEQLQERFSAHLLGPDVVMGALTSMYVHLPFVVTPCSTEGTEKYCS